jgi:hypothetical protein
MGTRYERGLGVPTHFTPRYNVKVTGDLRQECAQRMDAARRPS